MDVKLATLAKGALEERAAEEIQKALENIADPNTEWKKARKVTIELTFTPMDESRDRIAVSIKVKSSLEHNKPVGTQIFMGKDRDGNIIAEEYTRNAIPGQVEIDADTGKIKVSKVVNIKGGK